MYYSVLHYTYTYSHWLLVTYGHKSVHRYYTVSKKDTTKFHKDSARKKDHDNVKDAVEKAVTYLDRDELPPHWDRDVLFRMGAEDSTTESTSESESGGIDCEEEDEDNESPEEKVSTGRKIY